MSRYIFQSSKVGGQGPSQKGVYLDSQTGKQVFLKSASRQEYLSQLTLWQVSHRSNVIIPKSLSFEYVKGRSTIVMEYFSQAKSLISANLDTKINAYVQILDFLNHLNPKNFPGNLPAHLQLMSLPYVLLRNLIFYPSHSPLFFKAFFEILRHGLEWLRLKSDHVSHGDINVANILALKNKTILLDFSRCFVSHKYYNPSQAVNSAWFHSGFHQKLTVAIIQKYNFDNNQKRILNSFVIYNLLQRLSARYSKAVQEQFYLNRLEQLL